MEAAPAEALFQAASSWGTLFRLGRRLQLANKKEIDDHVPVHAAFPIGALEEGGSYAAEKKKQDMLNKEALVAGVEEAEGRREYVEELDRRSLNVSVSHIHYG